MESVPRKTSPFWMRPVSFTYLRDVIVEFASKVESFTAPEFDSVVRRRRLVVTEDGNLPSRTLLYHYRNTLTKLGILRREGRKYSIDKDNENVKILLDSGREEGEGLTVTEKTAFAELVIKNEDCKIFFDLFMRGVERYSLSEFLSDGKPVTWRREGKKPDAVYYKTRSGKLKEKKWPTPVIFRYLGDDEPVLKLNEYYEEKGILFGVRYWAIKELCFINEFFREDIGAVMYPVILDYGEQEVSTVLNEITGLVDIGKEWTTFSVRDLLLNLAVPGHFPMSVLFEAIKVLKKENPAQVIFIGTSRGFATYTAATKEAQELMLRSYFEDENKIIVSHFRLHKSVRRV